MSEKTSEDGTRKILDRLLEEGIKPNVHTLAPILESGRIAVLAFEPSEQARETLRVLGGDGQPAFPLSADGKRRLARADHVTRRWCHRNNGPGRIFVVMHEGTLLVNFDPDAGGFGYSIEPGSTDPGTLN